MKKVSRRALFALALAIVLAAGTLAFCVKYAVNADKWVTFSGSPHVYTGTNLTGGKIYDRTGARILNTTDGRVYSSDAAVRAAISLHALEHFLTVVENHSGRIKDDRLIRHDLRIVPTLLRVIFHHIHVICKDFTETELAFVCRLRFRRSGTLNLDFLHQKTLLSCLLIHILARICLFCKLPRLKLQKKLHK